MASAVRRRRGGPWLTVLLWASLLLWSQSARADLAAEALLLARQWRADGAQVTRLAPRFLFEGQVQALPFSQRRDHDRRCLSVTLLSDKKVQFAVLASTARTMSAQALVQAGVSSVAGSVNIEDCGDGALEEGRLLLAMASPRGSVEVLVSRHRGHLPPLEQLLRERDAGPLGPAPRALAATRSAPLKQRLARARNVARSDGARQLSVQLLPLDALGAGALTLSLVAGCHRLQLFAQTPAGAVLAPAAIDIDAEVSSDALGGLLARDRSHAADARLDVCIGEEGNVLLKYAGAGAARTMVMLDALWPAPLGLPAWGARWRTGALTSLRRRPAPALSAAPARQWLGTAGVSWVPLRVEPDTCYLAVAAVMRGEASAMRLSARWGQHVRYDDASSGPLGTAVSFCSGNQRRVGLQVDVRARSASWALSLWNMTAKPW